MKHLSYLLLLVFSSISLNAQLSVGDVAFVQYNADGPEIIKLLAFNDLAAGEVLNITDDGWLSSGAFRGSEGTAVYTVPAGGVACGEIITIDLSGPALSGSGDQLIVYQGTSASPSIITALNSDGAGVWQANATSANTSALPSGLTEGLNAVALNEIDNAKYTGPFTGDKATLRAAIHDNSNWAGSNTVEQDFTDVITVTDCGGGSTNTSVRFSAASSSVDEDGLFVTVCASITNEDATNATTVDVVLNASSTATNGTDYDDGAGTPAAVSFPISLTFPAGSAADQCFDLFISLDDMDLEGPETIVLDLTNIAGGNAAALGAITQHTVTINDNDAPDLVITEIVYNTASSYGDDDEWIEICNNQGADVDISGYSVEVHAGSSPSHTFTFPASTTLTDGSCITVALGAKSSTPFHNACEFTPDFGETPGSGSTNRLANSSRSIRIRDNFGGEVDNVAYDDGDVANTDGGESSMHLNDINADNSNTNLNWVEVVTGGSPGVNSLVSNCAPPNTVVEFAQSAITVNEGDGTFQVCLTIVNPDPSFDTEAYISVDALGTATTPEDVDEDGLGTPLTYFGFSKDYVIFPAGSSTDVCFDLHITDDADDEGQETFIIKIDPFDIGGGNQAIVGTNNSLTVNIEDNDGVVVTPCSDLFISEYIEGGSNNKCLEIYNPSSSEIDLEADGYAVYRYGNGASSPSDTLFLTGSMCPGEVLVICNPSSAASFLAEADTTHSVTFFNGDDAIQLVRGASTSSFGTSLDVIGQLGVDPGSSWSGGGCSTANRTLVRKSTIQQGDADGSNAFDPSVEWDCLAQDTDTELGGHTSDCIAASTCSITAITDGGNQTTCDPATNTYSNDVVITYADAPACGELEVNGQTFPITASPQTVILSGLTADGAPVDVSASFSADAGCSLSSTAVFTAPADCLPENTIVINEIDYDQVGTDNGEFIELYNNGTAAVDLDAYDVRLINGNGASSYLTIDLPAVSLAAGDYFVICIGSNASAYCDMSAGTSMQNGAPDGVELRFAGNQVDVMSYEGSVPGFVEGTGAGFDSNSIAQIGLSRIPNGVDTDDNSLDFAVNCITPGSENVVCAPNDNCSGAEFLTSFVFGEPGWQTFPLGATESMPGCAGGDADDDIWFEFVAMSANDQVIAQDPAGIYDVAIEIFDVCGGTSQGCFNNYGAGEVERATVGTLVPGDTYQFRVYDVASGASASTDVRVQVKTFEDGGLAPQYCDVLDYTLDQSIYALRDDLGQLYSNPLIPVKGYNFRFQEVGGGLDVEVIQPDGVPYLGLSNVPGLEYGKTYNVSVSHRVRLRANGSIDEYASAYKVECTIGLGTAPSTQLAAGYCGAAELQLSDQLFAEPVAGADQYRFTFVGGGQTIVEESGNYTVFLYNVEQMGNTLQMQTVYDVTVQSRVNGVWSAAGMPCSIGLGSPSGVEVQAAYCGGTYLAPNPNFILATQYNGADAYTWRFTPVGGGASQETVTAGLSLAFHTTDLVLESGQYAVEVKVTAGGVTGDYINPGTCVITINAGAEMLAEDEAELAANDKLLSESDFDLNLYPNPTSNGQVTLMLEGLSGASSAAEVDLIDVNGAIVSTERFAVKGQEARVLLDVSDIASGLYLVRVNTGGALSVRMLEVK